jgi:hypothetical protein
MRCEEALAILDDYVEGDLDARATYQLASHLGECEACARAHQSIKREQEIYSGFLVDVEASPLLWANLRKGIELEDAQRRRKSFSWPSVLSQSIFAMQRPVPLAVAMTVIVAALVLPYVWVRINSGPSQPGLIPNNAQLAENAGQPLGAQREPDMPPSSITSKETSSPIGPTQPISVRRHKQNSQRRELTVARTASEDMGTWLRNLTATTDSEEKFIPASSFTTETWDSDAAQHAQKAEVLLRSFRNIAAQRDAGVNVSYEKRQSRELIARNILLRREAQITGDLATEELLSRLEPILIDIANLPKKSSNRDVWQIQEQMRRDGIVSALHFRQTSPAVFD